MLLSVSLSGASPRVLGALRPPEALVAVRGDPAPGNAHHVAPHEKDVADLVGVGIGDAVLFHVVVPWLGVVPFDLHDGGVPAGEAQMGEGPVGRRPGVGVVLAEETER